MKTIQIKTIQFLSFLLLVTMTSCTSGSTKKSTNDTGVKAPDIDIHTATITGNIDAIKQHIAAGSNLNEKDPFGGSSPLITAAVFGQNEVAKLLIEAGADLNIQNNEGSTALISAAFFCRPEMVQMLIKAGADPNIRNKYGATANESVMGPFAEIKGVYEMLASQLGPMGLTLDYEYIEKTRPQIAEMLN
ncbi:ankyrin repeat domain-containing protein [Reichenbachiella ulvae]|uniref:Ankyrin repeat domain-containing protein n=1 Tax=Reichenbachiella ulvae TaxID=2980104 RepID=A0ABT3CRT3_9BACT|nr:ankyrin repeat domain-containing protein [Reichenbachiella ulvae]MCV9386421.1 ankyrin repeat domain-containing protein [Reichenbachiella ulvae]